MKALRVVPIQVTSKGLPVIIPVVQSDSGRSIDFVISDMTIPDEATAVFYAVKKDLKLITNNCAIADNTVTVNLTTQTLAVAGTVRCQIQIVSGEDIVTTFGFALDVERGLADDTAVESTNEFTALTEALQKVNSLVSGVKGDAETDYRTGQVSLTPANLGAAPISHATTATTYGIGTTANYGHCMTINNLTATAHENGKALSAYQGALLNGKISDLTPTVLDISTWLTNSTVIANTSRFAAQAIVTPKTVKISTVLSRTSATAEGTQIMTIPTAYRPAYEQQMSAVAGYAAITVAVTPAGALSVSGNGAIAAGTWIKISIEYFL